MRKGTVLLPIAVLMAVLVTTGQAAPARDLFLAKTTAEGQPAGWASPMTSSPLAAAAQTSSPAPDSKSIPKAFLLSLVLPGSGQFYAQAPGRGRLFVGTELAILAGYLGFRLYGDWKEEDYRLYAAAHARVDPRGKSEDYFEDVSIYMSMEEYNRQQLYDFREDAELYSGADFWEWDSDGSRRKFDSLYRASSNAGDDAILMTGLGLLNHLLSAVDAARTARAYNKQHTSRSHPIRLTLDLHPAPGSSVVMIGVKRTF